MNLPAFNPSGPLLALRLARLFPGAPLAGEEIRLSEDIPPPRPEEAAQVARAVSRRRLEYAAGRHCARQALGRLAGNEDFVLLNDADRAPRWPDGFVGSLTHTGSAPDGYCAAVLGRTSDLLAVGLDAEEAEALEPDLWPFVLTAGERHSLTAHPEASRGMLAKVIFSAKECYYKAQFPLTRRFLGFREVQIQLEFALEAGAGRFEARLVDPFVSDGIAHCEGRFLIESGFVLTGIVLPRIAPRLAPC